MGHSLRRKNRTVDKTDHTTSLESINIRYGVPASREHTYIYILQFSKQLKLNPTSELKAHIVQSTLHRRDIFVKAVSLNSDVTRKTLATYHMKCFLTTDDVCIQPTILTGTGVVSCRFCWNYFFSQCVFKRIVWENLKFLRTSEMLLLISSYTLLNVILIIITCHLTP